MVLSLLIAILGLWFFFKENGKETVLRASRQHSLVLSDSFLDTAVFKRKKDIQKHCPLKGKGAVYLEMEVVPSGSNQVKGLHATKGDQSLLKCAISILERIKFPSFSGSKIIRFYTIRWEP